MACVGRDEASFRERTRRRADERADRARKAAARRMVEESVTAQRAEEAAELVLGDLKQAFMNEAGEYTNMPIGQESGHLRMAGESVTAHRIGDS